MCWCVLCVCVEDRNELEGFESSVCCVIYCCPTSYRGKINIGDTFIS